MVRWLVAVKMNGNRPKKLFIITNRNKDENINVIPKFKGFLIKIKNSLWRVSKIILEIMFDREGETQKGEVIKIKKRIDLIQFRGMIKEEGSKDENKLVIIFN